MTIPFQFLKEVDNDSIHFAIVNEHPQTIAVIVSCLQPNQAAWIIESLPPERQLAVIYRIASLRKIELAVIAILEEEIRMKIENKEYVKLGGVDNIAEVLAFVDPGTRKNIMENLGQDDPELVDDIRCTIRADEIVQKREKSEQLLCPTCNFPLVRQRGRNGSKYWCSRCRNHKDCDAVIAHNYNDKTAIIK